MKLFSQKINFPKKITTYSLFSVIFIFLISGILFLKPHEAKGVWGVEDLVSDPLTELETTEIAIIENVTWIEKALASAEKMALAYFRKSLMNYITQNIIAWGQGKDAFTMDFSFSDVIDAAGGTFLNELTGINLCGDWGAKIKISLATIPTFKTGAVCTFSEIGQNYEDFMDDFNKSGWKGWIELTENSNNPYTIYLDALGEKLKKENEAKSQKEQKTLVGEGFLGDEVCKELEYCNDDDGCQTMLGTWEKEDIPEDDFEDGRTDTYECTKWETRTPGKIMADTIGFDIPKSSQDWLGTNEEWESYVVAITDSLINALITKGFSAITASDTDSNTGSDGSPSQPDVSKGPPTSQSNDYDAWHKSIDITSTGLSEDSGSYGVDISNYVMTYYTVDGSEPNRNVDHSQDTSLSTYTYNGPIEITSSCTLKWFAQNASAYSENVHSEDMEPPFSTSTSTLATAAAAVGSYGIALRTNVPAAIYYTTDGSTPSAASSRYIKKIGLSSSDSAQTIQWFGVSADGSATEETRSISTTPPFPNNEFLKYSKYTSDGSGLGTVTASASASDSSGYATLDPSGSSVTGKQNKIIQYEWDFNNDGTYDWYSLDYDRDGEFEESGCYASTSNLFPNNCGSSSASPSDIQISLSGNAGLIKVSSARVGSAVKLMITDANGLTAEATVNVH